MAFIRTVEPGEATGVLREIYDGNIAADGAVSNTNRALSLRPDVLAAWRPLARTIRGHLDPRRYELITTVVAARLRCSY